MSSSIPVQKGTTAIATFETLSRENGTRTAPDSLPTVEFVHVNGVINSTLTSGATVTQMQDATPANITGYYRVSFSTAALSANDDVDVSISATIAGTVAKKILRFLVVDQPGLIPVIR